MRSTINAMILSLLFLSNEYFSFGQEDDPKKLQPSGATDRLQKTKSLDDIRTALKNSGPSILGGMPGSMSGGGTPGMSSGTPGMSSGMGSSAGGYGGEGGMGMGGMSGAPPTPKQLLVDVINQLRSRLDSKKYKRDEVEKLLRSALQQYFIEDMEERVRDFDKVKARVVEMETKLQRRLDREGEIIELQLRQMLHKADGLDFFIPGSSRGGMSGYGGMGDGGMGGYGGEGGMGMGMPGAAMGTGGESAGGMGMGITGYGSVGSGGSGFGGYGTTTDPMIGPIDGNPSGFVGYDFFWGATRVVRSNKELRSEIDPLDQYGNSNKPLHEDALKSDANKMKAILNAMHEFHEIFHHLPNVVLRHDKNHPPHSWRVALLPLIGQGDLYRQYNFDEPWDSKSNIRLVETMPALYRAQDGNPSAPSFFMLDGGGAIGSLDRLAQISDITDGTSNTIAIVKLNRDIPWTKPEDISYAPNLPLPKFSSDRLVGFLDGVVMKLPDNIPDSEIRAAVTYAGGEPLKTLFVK